ncbi:McrC family protein [Exiguobacterium profundum]|uniref:McrC family protein n=1 Tax=Exiguobacterium profundum TaxID=307643 RepID=UPI00093C76A3|nr:hypothetical protein [Exiguobacterium profundum]
MKVITIKEGQDRIGINLEEESDFGLTFQESKMLEEHILSKGYDRQSFLWGRSSLQIVNYVGVIQLKTFSIEILPKVSLQKSDNFMEMRKILLMMLRESGYLKIDVNDISRFDMVDEPLFEILASEYSKQLLKELRRGVINRYEEVQENISFLKGSIRIGNHIRENLSRDVRHRVHCEYSELSPNHIINKIFVYANEILLNVVRNNDTRRRLELGNHLLSDVIAYRGIEEIVNHARLDRTEIRYDKSLQIAKQIILARSANRHSRQEYSFSILFKMNELFEVYIRSLLQKEFGEYLLDPQDSKHLLKEKWPNEDSDILRLRPDYRLNLGGKSVIIDAKWKKLNETRPRTGVGRDDIFQMYAYLSRFDDVSCVVLMYPLTYQDDKREPANLYYEWVTYDSSRKSIKAYSLSLNKREDTLEGLKRIIEELNGAES